MPIVVQPFRDRPDYFREAVENEQLFTTTCCGVKIRLLDEDYERITFNKANDHVGEIQCPHCKSLYKETKLRFSPSMAEREAKRRAQRNQLYVCLTLVGLLALGIFINL